MNANISGFLICIEATIYLLLYNLHNCTFNVPLKYFNILQYLGVKTLPAEDMKRYYI